MKIYLFLLIGSVQRFLLKKFSFFLVKPEEAFADFNEKSGKKIKFEKSNKSAEEELDSLGTQTIK